MRHVLAPFALGLLGACDNLTVLAYERADGILPVVYEATLTGLPASFAPEEWPDGVRLIETATGPIAVHAETLAGGDRVVALGRDVALLDEGGAVFYRDFFGQDKIASIREVDLALVDLVVDDMAEDAAPAPLLDAAGVVLPAGGAAARMPTSVLENLRSKLAAGEAVHVPFAVKFHLAAARLDALPARRLHLRVVVQPTLWVDVLDAL